MFYEINIDKIIDKKPGKGNSLSDELTTTHLSSTSEIEYLSSERCYIMRNIPHALGLGAVFTVEKVTSEISKIWIDSPILSSQILINEYPISNNLNLNSDKSYTLGTLGENITIPINTSENPKITTFGKRLSNICIKDISPWRYLAQYTLFGKVLYLDVVYNFKIKICDKENYSGHLIPEGTSTLKVKNLYIPSRSSKIKISFKGSISLLTPQLSCELENPFDPNSPLSIILTSKALVYPQVVIESIDTLRASIEL